MIIPVNNITKHVKPELRLLGLDFGSKTIGLALSAPLINGDFMCIASPLTTIRRTKFVNDAAALREIIHSYSVGGLIVGWPKHLNGKMSRRCQATHQFVLNLNHAGIRLPTAFFDERMSTRFAKNFLCTSLNVSRKKRRGAIDKVAAAFILEGALYALRHQTKDKTAIPLTEKEKEFFAGDSVNEHNG